MDLSVETLIELRNRTLDDFVDGRIERDEYRADLAAIAVQVDRLLSTDGLASLEERAGRVVAEIIADSRAQSVAVPPAKAARVEFWQRRRVDRLRRDDPQGYDAELREVAALDSEEPDEVRMARPIIAALSDESIAPSAPDRVQAMTVKPRAEADSVRVPPFPDVVWIDDDRLVWDEFIGGVPCQGCGRGFLGDETGRRDNEPWPAYRERMKPVEAAFKSMHPDHGTSWTVGGGPSHCRRCCPPHPLSPQQIERINQIVSRPTSAPTTAVQVRHCTTCRKPIEGNHVCQLADLPKTLRAVVEAVLEQERGRDSR